MEALFIFGALFVISICWIFQPKENVELEKSLPDESEVIGKDLPVGSKFMKNGKVVEVVKSMDCTGCIYGGCGMCNLDDVPKCYVSQRKDDNSVSFKYVDHE